MNRSIWTWLQLAVSLFNAVFMVISHLPGHASPAEIASLRAGQAAHHVLAAATHGIDPLFRDVGAPL